MTELNIDSLLPTGYEGEEVYELVDTFQLQDLMLTLGKDNFSFIISQINNLNSKEDTVRFLGILDKLLSKDRPKVVYDDVYRVPNNRAIDATIEELSKIKLLKYKSAWEEEFPNLRKSILSYLQLAISILRSREEEPNEDLDIDVKFEADDELTPVIETFIDRLFKSVYNEEVITKVLEIIKEDNDDLGKNPEDKSLLRLYFILGDEVEEDSDIEELVNDKAEILSTYIIARLEEQNN